jgi:hypothetical protein
MVASISPSMAEKKKIVVCRDMGEEAMGLLERSGHEVRSFFLIRRGMDAVSTDG